MSSPEVSFFRVTLLNEEHKPVQEGSLEATPSSLVYTGAGSFYSWPVRQLTRIEIKGNDLLVIEGRKMPLLNTGKYTFRTPQAKKIYSIISQEANRDALLPLATTKVTPINTPATTSVPISNSSSEFNSPVHHWRLNTSLPGDSSTNQSPVHAPLTSTSSVTRENCFLVERLLSDFKTTESGTMEVANADVIYTDGPSGLVYQWPIAYLRRFGYENDVFTVETGRRCVGGPGLYNFRTPRAFELNAALRMISSSADRNSLVSQSPSPTEVKAQSTPPPACVTAAPSTMTTPLSTSASVPPPPPNRRAPMPPPSSSSTPYHQYPQGPLPPLPSSTTSQNPPPLPGIPPGGFPSALTSPPPFVTSTPDSNLSGMRKAVSNFELARRTVFEVRNISDDKKEVGHGIVEVTDTDLIYVDSRTNEKWKWPYKFLRKYGYKQNVFTFEAGRRCAGGQGLYAFASPRASEIHEAIVESIRGGGGGGGHGGGGQRSSTVATPSSMSATPRVQLANTNQYNIDISPSLSGLHGTRRSLPTNSLTPPMAPPTSALPFVTPTSIAATNTATPSSTSATPTHIHTRVAASPSAPDHTPSLKEATPPVKDSGSKTPPPSSSSQQRYHEPVKPVVHRQHIYDVPAIGGGTTMNGDVTTPTPHPSEKSGSKDRLENSSSPDNAQDGGAASKEGAGLSAKTKKERLGVLGRFMNRKYRSGSADATASTTEEESPNTNTNKRSKRKKNRKKSTQGPKDHAPSKGNLSDGEVEETSATYQNLVEAKLCKKPFSASCDDLLSSMSDSYSSSLSSVPQPRLRDFETPPTDTHELTDGPNNPATFYQNLNEARRGYGESNGVTTSMPHPQQQSTQQTLTSSLNSDPNRTTSPPLYSNVIVGDSSDGRVPSLTPTPAQPQQETTYAVVEIVQGQKKKTPKVHPKLAQHSSLTDVHNKTHIPQTSSSNIETPPPGGLTVTQTTPISSLPRPRPQSEDGSKVIYGRLDFAAMEAISKIRQEHEDTKNFESLLERHDLREEELRRKINFQSQKKSGQKKTPKVMAEHSALTDVHSNNHIPQTSGGNVESNVNSPPGGLTITQTTPISSSPRPCPQSGDGSKVIYGQLEAISKIRQEHEGTKKFKSHLERQKINV